MTAKWDEAGITNRISQYKPVFKEPKTKTEFQSVMSEYYANIDNPQGNGAIFMAVCRGKVSTEWYKAYRKRILEVMDGETDNELWY